MALPSSGQITLDQIHVEAGGTSGTQAALNDSDIRGLIGASSGAAIDFADFYGVSAFSATHTLTQGSNTGTAVDYFGYFTSGSVSPTTFSGFTIRYIFRRLQDGSSSTLSELWIYLNGGSVPESTISNIKIECDDGTIVSLDGSDASTAQSASYRYYKWDPIDFASTSVHASFVTTFDGSGTVDMQFS